MSGRVFHDNRRTVEFPITAGLKKGCVLTPTLLSLYLAAMLHDILPENAGINMQYRFEADIFNTGDSPFPSELPSLIRNRGLNPKRNVAPENAALESLVPRLLFHVLTALYTRIKVSVLHTSKFILQIPNIIACTEFSNLA